MSNRSRRILAWVVAVAGIAMLAYVAVMAVLIVRGDLEAGPVRLTTLVLNVATGIALLVLARLTIRALPPRA